MVLIGVLGLIMANSCNGKADKKFESEAQENHIRDGNDGKLIEQAYADEEFSETLVSRVAATTIDNKQSTSGVKVAEYIKPIEMAEMNGMNKTEIDDSLEAAIRGIEAYIWEKTRFVDTVYFTDFIILKNDFEIPKLDSDYEKKELKNMIDNMVLASNTWEIKENKNKNKEVWKAKHTDGSLLRYMLKDGNGREVFKEHAGGEKNFVKEIKTDDKYVEKTKSNGQKNVLKMKEKQSDIVIKEKFKGEKTVTRVEKKYRGVA